VPLNHRSETERPVLGALAPYIDRAPGAGYSRGMPNEARLPNAAWFLIFLIALLPTWGTLAAGLISEDGAVLGFVHRHGSFADWFTSQYDLRFVRFWRPLATTSLGVQLQTTGVDVVWLRMFNILCHGASALVLAGLALRLSLGRWSALAAGILAGLYPYQGGTVIWIVGRVDSLCLLLFLTACWLALADRAWLSAITAFLAMATKETALVLPAWIFLLALGTGERPGRAFRRALPALLVLALVLVWRRLALGVWVGGYLPDGDRCAGLTTLLAVGGARFSRAVSLDMLAVAVVTIAGWWAGRWRLRGRLWLCCLGAAAVGVVPILGILSLEDVRPTDLRRFILVDAGLVLALAAAVAGRPRRRAAAALLILLTICVAAWRAGRARAAVLTWVEGARCATELVVRTRRAASGLAVSSHPVLHARVPVLHAGALVFPHGFADHFLAPFPETPRPVWPWRPLFRHPASYCPPLYATTNGLLDPFARGRKPALPVRILDRGEPVDTLRVDRRVLGIEEKGRGGAPPVLEVHLPDGPCRLEILAVTRSGYEPATWSPPEAPRGAGTNRVVRLSVHELLGLRTRVFDHLLMHVLGRAADLGARQAYLEVRAVSKHNGHERVEASRWVRITWSPEARDWVSPQ